MFTDAASNIIHSIINVLVHRLLCSKTKLKNHIINYWSRYTHANVINKNCQFTKLSYYLYVEVQKTLAASKCYKTNA